MRDGKGNVKLNCPMLGKQFAPEEVSAEVLRKLTDDASKYLGEKVTQAVITVPAYFNDSQRQATKDAGKIAGLEVLRIINEPTAAALAYGLAQKGNETILVFDLGGGTFADEFKKNEGIDLRKDKQALQRLTEAAEKAKIELSNATQTNINLPSITASQDGPKHLNMTLTRAKFESMCADLIDRCRIPVEQALQDSQLSNSDIDELVLVGGSTRTPAVQDLVRRMIGKDPCQGVNPDEVVAVGAAIQAGVLAGEVKDLLLLDVTPLSLGVETLGGVMTRLVPRNTTVPVQKSEIFSTAADGQTSVEIQVLQGERELARENKSLGTFRLEGIPSAPRGIPQIEVTFDIDANGMLSVSAHDKASGKQQSITITGASTLDEKEVERMIQQAEAHAAEDHKRRSQIDTKNIADSAVYQAEKQLKDLGDKVPSADKTRVESLIKDLREAVNQENYDRMKSLTEELQQALMQVGSAVYAQAGASAGGAGNNRGSNNGSSDDVIDADFVQGK